MNSPQQSTGSFRRHEHPLAFVLIFLLIAGVALILITVGSSNTDTGSGGTPGPELGFQCPRGEPSGFELSDVEGKTLTEVEQWAKSEGLTVRVVAEDGQPMAATADYRADRVNVQVEAGVVTRYCGSG